ncbi:ABC transporter substrate-binding protein [Frankia sp. CNm7]|uniref:ABC transporter substrate-binding protein n=1 Tax=Frankia nepalensis TaxID=1836974 RepID=A0A937RHR9_9ACTN|nr:ABC transporter substrate-binding protein [Frankia nepalensis]MBL7496356.1 ABC transporter substrate-binding protein [Frankia nepalensis]MBL7508447.1 ABC transporter substrate-binding protein [Frankia nepalensis]MBL7520265.1 ABC transporter substrate-binding protein [Frankia nepalensis]MBL7627579.1 ABC transporter substrate-binding protein [Frankia nepalensis]
MRLRTPRILLEATAVVLVVAVIGCAPSRDGNGQGATCDAPGITPSEATLGFVYPDSGPPSSVFVSARAGFDARIGLANAEGGVHGRRISAQWRDDEGSATVGALAVEDLVQHGQVFGLVTASASLHDSMERLTKQGVPVTGLAIEPAWVGRANMFAVVYSASPVVVGRYIQDAGGTKVAIVTPDTSPVTESAVTSYTQGLNAAGINTVARFTFSAAVGDPAQVAQKIAEFGADALLGIEAPDEFGKVVQATRAARMPLTVSVALSGYDRSLLGTLGPSLAGVSIPVFFRPFEAGGPAIDRYRDAMASYAPESTETDQQFAMFTYINTDLFLRGLELAGPCPTREGFIRALRGVSDYDAGGLIAPVDLRNYAGEPLSCYAFVRVSSAGTEFEPVRERVCADGSTG